MFSRMSLRKLAKTVSKEASLSLKILFIPLLPNAPAKVRRNLSPKLVDKRVGGWGHPLMQQMYHILIHGPTEIKLMADHPLKGFGKDTMEEQMGGAFHIHFAEDTSIRNWNLHLAKLS